MQEPTKKISKAREKPQDGRRDATMIKSNPIPTGGQHTSWRTTTPQRFSHCCEGPKPHIRLPNLRISQRDLTKSVPRESDFEGQRELTAGLPQDWRKQTLLLEDTNKIVCTPGHRERSRDPPGD